MTVRALERLIDPIYKAKPQRAIVFTLEAWDANCRQHIVPRYSEAEMVAKLAASGFSASRAHVNIGHNPWRMTFVARHAF